MVRVSLTFLAAVPVGHHVTAIALEVRSLFDAGYKPSQEVILCDDDTRIVYAAYGVGTDAMTYETIHFPPSGNYRISPVVPPLRGRVTSCVVLSGSDSAVTVLMVEPDR